MEQSVELLICQIDYILLVSGFGFLMLALAAHFMRQRAERLSSWNWIALFGFTMALSEWIELASLSQGNMEILGYEHIFLRTASWLALVEFGRSNCPGPFRSLHRAWLYFPLLIVAALGGLKGLSGAVATINLLLGLAGGGWTAFALASQSGQPPGKNKYLTVMSGLIGALAIIMAVVPPSSSFFPLSDWNQDVFHQATGMPISLVRGLLGIAIMIIAWQQYLSLTKSSKLESAGLRQPSFLFGLGWFFAGIFIIGWQATQITTDYTAKLMKRELVSRVSVASASIAHESVKTLTGTLADLDSSDYQRLKRQLLNMRNATPEGDGWHVSLVRFNGDRLVVLVDSEETTNKTYNPPGSTFANASPALLKVLKEGLPEAEEPALHHGKLVVRACAFPIRDALTRRGLATMVMEMRGDDWFNQLVSSRLTTIGVTYLAAILLVGFVVVRHTGWQSAFDLAISEERLGKIFKYSPLAMFLSTWSDHRIREVNEAFLQLSGLDRANLVGRTELELGLWASEASWTEAMRNLGSDQTCAGDKLRFKTQSGRVIDCLASFRRVHVDGTDCVLTQLVDITEREAMVRQLAHRDQLLEVTAHLANLLLRASDLKRCIQESLEILGRTLETDRAYIILSRAETPASETVHRQHYQWNRPGVAPRWTESQPPASSLQEAFPSWHDLLLAGKVVRGLVRQLPDNERSHLQGLGVISFLAVPILMDGDLEGFIGFDDCQTERDWSDVETAILSAAAGSLGGAIRRKEAESILHQRTHQLAQANAELGKAARLKDEFLASMSHELRTPLNSVLGLAEAMSEQVYGSLNDKQLNCLKGIEESGRHLLSLINDILDLSKIEAGKVVLEPGWVVLEPMCETSLRFVREAAQKKNIRLELALDRRIPGFEADERRLKQILVNLLSNAVKFTPEGGRVGLEVNLDASGHDLCFAVWDTGIGISKEDQSRLFQPFVQLDTRLSRQYNGTGLGLSLVRCLAELHQGSVSLDSEPGKGSRFTVSLPYKAMRLDPGPKGEQAMPSPLSSALVIEDSSPASDQLTRYIGEIGAQVTVHSRGQGAWEKAVELKPDLILLDILLPDLSGWNVLAQLRSDQRTRHIPVVIVTILDERARGFEQGASQYLVKPISRDQLHQAVHKALAGKSTAEDQPDLMAHSPDQPLLLLAEDNLSNVSLFAEYLGNKGYRLNVARNGREAIQLAEENCPDLILMDVQMPEMDGLEASRCLRANPRFAKVPIVALTALAMVGDKERCLAAGMNEYLTKPVSLKQLVQTIETLLHSQDQLKPCVIPS